MKVVAEVGNNDYYCHAAIVEVQEALAAGGDCATDGGLQRAIQLLTLARAYNAK